MHIHRARIWTGDPRQPWAKAMRVANGRIEAIGPAAAAARGAGTIDASGAFILPGLIDAHLHLLMAGLALGQLDLSAVRSRAELERRIAAAHAALPPDRWLIAGGWATEQWDEPAPAHRSWLAAAGDRPVVCHRADLHAVLVNDAVLRRLDLSRDPPGGRIVRDERGEPTGLMVEAAAWQLVNPLIPEPALEERRAALRAACARSSAAGVTAVGTMEMLCDVQEIFVPARDELTVRCRVTLLDQDSPLPIDAARAIPAGDRLAVIGFKSFLDGTLGSRTARMLAPYIDDPGNRGLLLEPAASGGLAHWAAEVAGAGFSPSMHAIGDEAVRLALDVIEGVDPARRPRLEHAQHIDLVDIPRMRGVIASMQPLHKAHDGVYAEQRLGAARLAGAFPFRSLAEAGAHLAFGSDWPVVDPDPFAGIAAAVTGRTVSGGLFVPGESISVDAALRAYTSGAAYALGMDGFGVLKEGAPADFVMVDRDPFQIDLAQERPRVLMTVVGGDAVYEASQPLLTQSRRAAK